MRSISESAGRGMAPRPHCRPGKGQEFDADPRSSRRVAVVPPPGQGQRFQVTAFDEDAGTVEIQDFDGDLEEVDIDEWYTLEIETIEPPEDWTGPVDDIGRDDLGYSDTATSGEDWIGTVEDGIERGGTGSGRRRMRALRAVGTVPVPIQ
ncbi:MAG: hypothetical protein MZV65_34550 [Chromatiales bacterium]|nr:hypothetical protein [Chromatiales bacterium]